MKNLKLIFRREQEELFLKTQKREADFFPAGRPHFVQKVLLRGGEHVCDPYVFKGLLWSECVPPKSTC